ncbi:MAG: hypothetical protein ACXIVQ_16845 [Acidimicrobiales bacterium]
MTATEPLDLLDRQARSAAAGVRAAHATPPPFRRPRRTSHQTFGRVLAAAAALVLVAATVAVLSGQNDDTTTIADDPPVVQPTEPIAPTFVPGGLDLVGLATPDEDVPASRLDVFGVVDADDPFSGPIAVLGVGGDVPEEVPAETTVDVGGIEVRIFPTRAADGSMVDHLEWTGFDGENRSLMVYGADRDSVLALTGAILGEGQYPDGWGSIMPEGGIPGSWSLTYANAPWTRDLSVGLLGGDDHGLRTVAGLSNLAFCGGTRCDTQIELDGRPAWILRTEVVVGVSDGVDETMERQEVIMLTFRHSSGWIVNMAGSGISEREMIAVAESLTSTTWDELNGQLAGPPGRGFGLTTTTILESTIQG